MAKYTVLLVETSKRYGDFVVEANSMSKARELASNEFKRTRDMFDLDVKTSVRIDVLQSEEE